MSRSIFRTKTVVPCWRLRIKYGRLSASLPLSFSACQRSGNLCPSVVPPPRRDFACAATVEYGECKLTSSTPAASVSIIQSTISVGLLNRSRQCRHVSFSDAVASITYSSSRLYVHFWATSIYYSYKRLLVRLSRL